MPVRLFKNTGFSAICVVASMGVTVYYSFTAIWPTLMTTVYLEDVEAAGIRSAVVGGGVLLGQICGGFGLSFIPKVKWQAILMTSCAAAFTGALACLDENSYATTIALGLLSCFCTGYVDNITFPGVTLVIGAQDIGLATGVMGSIRALGGAIAQSLYVTILTNKVSTYLPKNVAPAAIAAGLPESSLTALFNGIATGNFTAVPGINANIQAVVGQQVVHSYVQAFRIVFYATIPFGFCLVVGAFFIPNMDDHLHKKVARRLQHMGSLDGEAKEGKSLEDLNETDEIRS
jgi:Fungal trichothecene efflux pump (TRI12)